MVSFNSIKMICKGFKKVPLKDTKGVLTKANNFKWVKINKYGTQTTIYNNGTKVTNFITDGKKLVERPDLKGYLRVTQKDGSYKLYQGSLVKEKNGHLLDINDIKLIKEKTPQEVLAEKARIAAEKLDKKRKAFIEKFNKKYERTFIKGDDGSITKLTHDRKTGKLVHWFRKDGKTGKFSIGNILYYPLGKEIYVETPDKFIFKNVLKDGIGFKQVDKVEVPKKRNK